MFIFPPLTTALIGAYGWRRAYLILGLLAVCGIVACASFIVRDPEKMGLHPDGQLREISLPEHPTAAVVVEEGYTLADAQRTGAFWLLNIIFGLTWLVVFMPMVHIVPLAVDLGISHFCAAMTISVIGFTGFGGRLAIGTISDRFGRVATLAMCLLLQGVSFAGFTISTVLLPLYTAAAVFGFSYGGITALFPALLGDFFGRIEIGAIVGFIFCASRFPRRIRPAYRRLHV
jgi:predicted MFS family arabinose efflux permease